MMSLHRLWPRLERAPLQRVPGQLVRGQGLGLPQAPVRRLQVAELQGLEGQVVVQRQAAMRQQVHLQFPARQTGRFPD